MNDPEKFFLPIFMSIHPFYAVEQSLFIQLLIGQKWQKPGKMSGYNVDTGKIFYDKLGYTYIELSKFVKAVSELETDLDRWLYVLKNMNRIDKTPVYLRKPIFEKLFSIAEFTNLTKEEKTMYDSSLKYKWDNKNVLDYAVKEGIEKGIAEGEHKKAVAIAREMKKESIPVAQIVKFTKLSTEEIERL